MFRKKRKKEIAEPGIVALFEKRAELYSRLCTLYDVCHVSSNEITIKKAREDAEGIKNQIAEVESRLVKRYLDLEWLMIQRGR